MTDEPNPRNIINLHGEDKETLFWNLKTWLIVEKAEELQKRGDDLWENYKEVKDQRLLALVGMLCVENALDELLEGFILDFKNLKEDSDVTFSLKIKFAKALHLIPRKILNSCDLIRKIRNSFAHDLNLTEFSSLNKDYINRLGPYVKEFNSEIGKSLDLVGLYRELVGITILGLLAYSYQIRALRGYLKTEDFRMHFKKYSELS